MSSTPVSNSSRLAALALLGWMSLEEALIFLQNECVQPEPLSASQAEEIWREYRGRVESLPADVPRAAEILPMSEADVKAARRFRSRYPGESIVDIVRLNPMELLVHQHWISPSLAEPYAASSSPAKWIQTALLDPPSASPSKPRRDGNTIVYDLPHPEFVLTERFGAEPLLQVTEPKAFVTVGFHNGRAILLTGYHRTFALARHLLTMPDSPRGVLFGVSNALDLLGDDAEDVKAMMTSARPPRLADFFSPDLAVPVSIRKRQYQIRIQYEVASLDAPEVPDPGALAAGSVRKSRPHSR